MKWILVAALVLLCAACGPTPPPADARDFEPAALPPSGPQPWQKGTPKPTPSPTPRPQPPAAAVPVPNRTAEEALTPAELKAKVLALMREGVDQDLVLTFVTRQKLSGKLTVDDILDWKRAGISDEVVKAAAAK
jgi:hypothetical protein